MSRFATGSIASRHSRSPRRGATGRCFSKKTSRRRSPATASPRTAHRCCGGCGWSSVQLHTCFQLPLSEYPALNGSRTQRALHKLLFDPTDGLVACLLELEDQGALERRGGELHFLDLVPDAHRPR